MSRRIIEKEFLLLKTFMTGFDVYDVMNAHFVVCGVYLACLMVSQAMSRLDVQNMRSKSIFRNIYF